MYNKKSEQIERSLFFFFSKCTNILDSHFFTLSPLTFLFLMKKNFIYFLAIYWSLQMYALIACL